MASAHPRPHGGERDHAWDALEKRLECFQLMVVSDMPRAIAEADGSPQNVEKITATIKSAYEKTKKYIQTLRTRIQATVGPQGDRLFAEVRTYHQENIMQELATTLGITADMLQPSLDLSRCLEDVATRADNTYQKAVADFNESFQAAAAHAAHAAAVARGQGSGTGVPVTPFLAVATAANQQHLHQQHLQQLQQQQQQHQQQLQHHQLQLQQKQKQKQQKQPQYHQRLPATAANSVVVAAVANRGVGSTSTSRGGAGASAKASGAYSAGGWTSAASGTNGGNGGSGSSGATVGVGDYTGVGGQGVAGDITGLKRQEGGGSVVARSERLPEEDKHGLLKIPRDLEAISEEVRSVVNVETLLMEERQLRSSFDSSPEQVTSQGGDQTRKESTQQQQKQPWFAKNVVDHRSAWCGLRDAGKRAGLDLVLQPRPWGDPLDPLAGGRQAVASDVLRLMSEATQTYLKQFLSELKTVAWQRRGGLSGDILTGLDTRMEDSRLPPPAIELRMGLIPRLPREGKEVCDPREILRRERDEHRKECAEREALWEADALKALIKGDEEHKRAARRGSASRDGAQAGGTSAIDAFEAASRSGWLSREQLAANEFVKRVALEHGVGLSAAMMAQRKRKNSSTRKSPEKQQGRKDDGISLDNAESTCDPAVSLRPTGAGRDEASDHDQPSQKRRKQDHGEESQKHRSKRAFLAAKNEEALDLVRNVRRRMDGGTREEGSGLQNGNGATKPARKEINNVDLEAYVRATRLTCSVGSRPLLSSIRRRMAAQRFRAVERNSSTPLV